MLTKFLENFEGNFEIKKKIYINEILKCLLIYLGEF